jgi:hypothetical protein
LRKILRVFSEEDVKELMDICDPWPSSDEVTFIKVNDPTHVYRDDEVVLVNSNGMIVSPKIP